MTKTKKRFRWNRATPPPCPNCGKKTFLKMRQDADKLLPSPTGTIRSGANDIYAWLSIRKVR